MQPFPRISESTHQPMGVGPVSLAVLAIVLWGGTAVSSRFAMDVLPPLFVGGGRFALAAVFMVGWCLLERSPLMLKPGQWRIAFMLGVLLFVQIGTFNLGTYRTSSSHASILVNSYIFWVAGYEHFVQRTIRLRWWQCLGLLLAGAGCSCLLFAAAEEPSLDSRDAATLWGDLILLFSGLVLGIKVVLTKRSVHGIKPGPLILWHDVFGTLMFFACSFWIGETFRGPMTAAAWMALLYGGLVVSGFCYGVNALLLRRHGASQVSVFSFGTPICGVALGVLLRGDHLSLWLILAGALVAAGIFLVNYAPRVPAVESLP